MMIAQATGATARQIEIPWLQIGLGVVAVVLIAACIAALIIVVRKSAA